MSSDPFENLSDDDLGYAPKAGGIAARAGMAADVPYLRSLNAEQREAVESLDGPNPNDYVHAQFRRIAQG